MLEKHIVHTFLLFSTWFFIRMFGMGNTTVWFFSLEMFFKTWKININKTSYSKFKFRQIENMEGQLQYQIWKSQEGKPILHVKYAIWGALHLQVFEDNGSWALLHLVCRGSANIIRCHYVTLVTCWVAALVEHMNVRMNLVLT